MQLANKQRVRTSFFTSITFCCVLVVLPVQIQPNTPTARENRTSKTKLLDTPISTENREGRLAVFDDVWQTVHDRYYDSSFGGVDWGQKRELFRPRAEAANGPGELYSI